jgi:hypothetical protein
MATEIPISFPIEKPDVGETVDAFKKLKSEFKEATSALAGLKEEVIIEVVTELLRLWKDVVTET